jgi:hypothetical protein
VRRRSEGQSPLWLFALDASSRAKPQSGDSAAAASPHSRTQAWAQVGDRLQANVVRARGVLVDFHFRIVDVQIYRSKSVSFFLAFPTRSPLSAHPRPAHFPFRLLHSFAILLLMRKRAWLIILGAIAALALGLWMTWPAPGPSYDGLSLSKWLQIELWARDEAQAEAQAAIRHIGTNAIPILLDWIRYEPNPICAKLESYATLLPDTLRDSSALRWLLDDRRLSRSALASTGFQALGEIAASAVPELADIAANTNGSLASEQAIQALPFLGPRAIPPLLRMAKEKRHPRRDDIIQALKNVLEDNYEQKEALQYLIGCAHDTDVDIAKVTCHALVLMDSTPHAGEAVALLTNSLASDEPSIRQLAADSLSGITLHPGLAPTTFALQRALLDPDADVRYAATNSLIRIAPHVLPISAIQNALQDQDLSARHTATNALLKLAPELITNGPPGQ